MEGFAAPGLYAPATLPPEYASAELDARPARVQGDQPGAVVILLEIDVRGLDA